MNEGRIAIALIVAAILLGLFLVAYFQYRRGQKAMKARQDIIAQQLEVLKKKQEQMDHYKAELKKSTEELETDHLKEAYGAEHAAHLIRIRENVLRDVTPDEETHWWQQQALDSVFRRKLKECKEKGITVTAEGFPPGGLDCTIDSVMEQIALFVNLFDNAIEACMLMPEDQERWIRIHAEQAQKKLIFRMENSCSRKSRRLEGRKTWKTDVKNHGIGMEIVQEIIRKQRGRIIFDQEKERYWAEIVLVGR